MRTASQGPKLLKGALVAVDPENPRQKQTTIVFQYNPETVSRTLAPQSGEQSDAGPERALRYKGPPSETFTLHAELDAADALERGDATARTLGIYPQLFALEVLTYPTSADVVDTGKLADQGKIEVGSAYAAPLILLVWGPQRVLPVLLTNVQVEETNFDPRLNPVQAKVTLTMRALTYADVDKRHKAYSLFLAYQKSKERQATQGVVGSEYARNLIGVDVRTRL
jgi:hypothetical protein